MSEVTRILSAIEQGDPHAAAHLLPLVYDELRRLAAAQLAAEKPGQTLQATALVHEAYLRLVDVDRVQHWDSRAHFFAAAAEAMRRILIEQARRKKADKAGGGWRRRSWPRRSRGRRSRRRRWCMKPTCASSMSKECSTGKAEAISSPPPPRPCVAFWLRTCGGSGL